MGAPGGTGGFGGNTHVDINGNVSVNTYESGGGGGFYGNGRAWSGSLWNFSLVGQNNNGGGGASFANLALGGGFSPSYTPPGTSSGGFGGGGGASPIMGGGGGGWSGGGGGYSRGNPAIDSAGGGGSYIDANATSVATSDGQYELSGTFNGASITNLGFYNNSAGYISIVKL